MKEKIPMIAVVGPTASGKTALAVELAKDGKRRESMALALQKNFCTNSTEEIISHVTAQVEKQWQKALAGAL